MTDEERAQEIVNGAFLHTHEKWAMKMAIKRAFADIRADEREKCAKVADKHDTGDMQREDMEARRIAAAIRAMGDN